jgi:hypothetical protein
MSIVDEIEEAMQGKATPIFLLGLLELYDEKPALIRGTVRTAGDRIYKRQEKEHAIQNERAVSRIRACGASRLRSRGRAGSTSFN